MRKYSSFSEIDDHLRVLKLKRQINIESMRLHLSHVKVSLYPNALVDGAKGILQKILLTYAIKRLYNLSRHLRPFRRRKQTELLE